MDSLSRSLLALAIWAMPAAASAQQKSHFLDAIEPVFTLPPGAVLEAGSHAVQKKLYLRSDFIDPVLENDALKTRLYARKELPARTPVKLTDVGETMPSAVAALVPPGKRTLTLLTPPEQVRAASICRFHEPLEVSIAGLEGGTGSRTRDGRLLTYISPEKSSAEMLAVVVAVPAGFSPPRHAPGPYQADIKCLRIEQYE